MGKSKKQKGTKQTLKYVEEEFKWHVSRIKYKNPRQKELVEAIQNNEIIMSSGGAGCGKSYCSLYAALQMLEKGQTSQVVLVKSVTTLPGEEVGYLSGDLMQKLDPYMLSFYLNIDKLIGKEARIKLMQQEKLIVQPLFSLRGITATDQTFIIDEAQNFNLEVFKTIITRIGENCHFVFLGDPFQIDLKKRNESVFKRMMDRFKDKVKGVHVMEFNPEDQARNPIITKVLQILEEF